MSSSVSSKSSLDSHHEHASQPCDFSAQLSERCCEQREDFQALLEDVGTSVSNYCRKRPVMASLAVFVVGFYVGWKVKPW
ncbi:MAG: hypothetical protein KDA72_06255 [Planctomycetales bacterium]|nr:hypothetical protein [Planctomycetales bacterium]